MRDKTVLQSRYVPEELPHREEQIHSIAEILAPALKGDRPSNILLLGKTGTGKTAVINYIGRQIRKAYPNGDSCVFVYINCAITDTIYGVMSKLASELISDEEFRIPATGLSLDRLKSDLMSYMDSRDRTFIVALDEIDLTSRMNGDDLLFQLMSMNDGMASSRISLIGITNNSKFADMLNPRISTRLSEVKMVFPPYTAEQIGDILSERASLAFDKGILEEGVVSYCAAIVAKNGGDARRAIELLRMSAVIAERNGDSKVTEAHVKASKNVFEADAMTEVIRTLNLHSKLVLMSIIRNAD